MDLSTLPYVLSFLLVMIGVYCVLSNRDLIKIIFGLSISGCGVNLLFVQLGYVRGASAPVPPLGATVVDPLLQAFVLTAIVIEFGLTMFMLSLAMRVFNATGDTDTRALRRLQG